ncbi:hypothetical protein GCM10010387_00150 [Streptomyces inusitatus]|uniref:Uncharacterized protein n=1 Tax=Streptomyces inusitatus TaxID=68221 RepID=A0A918UI77_9ACTN|nr:hypothetical protein [Streptomyces inusitatus]GGZ12275.1 hypothetical protein GCM10010387_00150 [Streptomyces inusitatus]
MPRILTPERAAGRKRVLKEKDAVIALYHADETPLTVVARKYDVGDVWLREQLQAWGVHIRTHAEAMKAQARWQKRETENPDTVSTFRRKAPPTHGDTR